MTTAEIAIKLEIIAWHLKNQPESLNTFGNASDALWVIQQSLKTILAEEQN
jgi:hypothetical protein